MKRPISRSIAFSLAAFAALGLSAGSALADTGAVAMTSPQVRDQFRQCGFKVDVTGTNSTFPVRDPGDTLMNSRVLLVFVYRDPETAAVAHGRAHALAEQNEHRTVDLSVDVGPQLQAGYSGSVWRYNLALVQADLRSLSGLYSTDIQTDETRIARPEAFDLKFSDATAPQRVDFDFVSCVDQMPTMLALEQDTASGANQALLLQQSLFRST